MAHDPRNPNKQPGSNAGSTHVTAPSSPRRRFMVGRRGLGNVLAPMNVFMPMGTTIGGATGMQLTPFSLDAFASAIEEGRAPGIDLRGTIAHPAGDQINLMSAVGGGAPGDRHKVVVVDMEDRHAAQIAQHPDALIERDHRLGYSNPVAVAPGVVGQDPSVNQYLLERAMLERRQALYRAVYAPSSKVAPNTLTVSVCDERGAPLAKAEVMAFGTSGSAVAKETTGDDGTATLDFGGTPATGIVGIYVKPAFDYWERFIPRPQVESGGSLSVVLRPLSSTFPDFPRKGVVGWGIREMRIDALHKGIDGSGVRAAIIDSGAATTHDDLSDQVRQGYDLVDKSDTTWQEDLISHGSHCAGVVTGLSPEGVGIRGIAPGADVTALKIFPGGTFSDLIGALHECMTRRIEVVNLSLGSDQPSELVEQTIVQAKNQGVACIVAAGNSGGPVQYPASSANTLAVAAIGKFGTFPQDSFHAMQVMTEMGSVPTQDGLFSARFSCYGPEIDVCAPGVAILSSVPPNNYASWDGTSMATPHVTGLAALVLAHHPEFRGQSFGSSALRVERLFQLLKASARPLSLGDPRRTGAGLPDGPTALGSAS